MTIEQALPVMLDEIMEIIEDGRAYLKSQGIDQWQNGSPNRAMVSADIEKGNGRIFLVDGKIVGYASVNFEGDACYNNIDGAWLDDEPYAVVHRCAMKRAERGKGYGDMMFKTIAEFVRSQGCGEIRIDTHRDNRVMQHLFDKNGFVYCGVVQLESGERIAFQKNL